MQNDIKPIDFVISWVDGNDLNWQKRRNSVKNNNNEDFRIERYRDWGLLKYWFRSVEANAPWVRKIFFVCDQEPPSWLREDHPKLEIVRHETFIPQQYLPTFSSHPIELNSYRIPGLSEQFVYFCDDMFILKPMKPTDFFKSGLPVDCAGLNPIPTDDLAKKSKDKKIFYIPLNDVEYLNREFDFRLCIKKNPSKWFNPLYGSFFFRNLIFSSYSRFIGFYVFHLAQPYRKTAFEEAWQNNYDILNETCMHKFRDDHDVSQSFIRFRQLAQGKFIPGKPINHAAFHISEDNSEICSIIANQALPMICLNDGDINSASFEQIKKELIDSFDTVFPNKSRFER